MKPPGYSVELSSAFENLNEDQLELVGPLFVPRHEPAGTVLFDQGDPAECIYVVIKGEVHINYKPEDGPSLIVARIRPTGVVGWSAALGNPNYTSAAYCADDSSMLCIRGEELRKLYEENPEIGEIILEHLAVMIAERLRNTHSHVIALLQKGLRIKLDRKEKVEQVRESY